MAKLKPEFDRRNVKLIGLSVDPIENHAKWAVDIEETQGAAPNYPMIGDTDLRIAKLYGMLPASASGDASVRTPADNQTVRNVFVIGPDKKIKLIISYATVSLKLQRSKSGSLAWILRSTWPSIIECFRGRIRHRHRPWLRGGKDSRRLGERSPDSNLRPSGHVSRLSVFSGSRRSLGSFCRRHPRG
jgi:peroxiredoxin